MPDTANTIVEQAELACSLGVHGWLQETPQRVFSQNVTVLLCQVLGCENTQAEGVNDQSGQEKQPESSGKWHLPPKSTSTDIKGRSNRPEAPDLALLRTWTAKKQPRGVAATGSSRLRLGSHQGSNQGAPDWRSLSLCNLVFQQTNLKYEL